MKTKILGIAASLRNARWGIGNRQLIEELTKCHTEAELKKYLDQQAQLHLENFIDAGREEGLSFDETYKNLKKLKGNRGLSNSEVALAAGLWSAEKSGCEIEHISLSEYFPANGVNRKIDELKDHLRNADGFMLSTPVYFGDRGSLAQALVDDIQNDKKLQTELRDKIYAGIAVGAKRNGGQETTLIYQLLDFVNAGFLGVGNDSDTTSQYGGTGHAGDVGTMSRDDYGLETSMGTGRRISHVASIAKLGKKTQLKGKVRVIFWVLQDKQNQALDYVNEITEQFATEIDPTVIDVTGKYISRCLACDICPTHIDVDNVYRCIIPSGKRDQMGDLHSQLLNHDAIIPVVFSPANREGIASNYQSFIERTRYLRRGDYVLGDVLVAPLLLEDLGVNDNMHIRMLTSMIRHHTILSKPMISYIDNNKMLNSSIVKNQFKDYVSTAKVLVSGKLKSFADSQDTGLSKYNPVGYILSAEKDKEDEKLKTRMKMTSDRNNKMKKDAQSRLRKEKLAT
mgnify:CR=1 FL=1